MINQSKSDSSYLDKIHGKVKVIEQNLKNFKLKSRTIFEQLVDEEQTLMSEILMWDQKFDSYAQEKNETSQPQLKKVAQRATSVSNRLFKQKQLESSQDGDTNREGEELDQIKRTLEKLDDQLIQNGGINCGWDAPDHKDFLRIRTKHNGKTNTVGFKKR